MISLALTNTRGQNLNFVENSIYEGKKQEEFLKKYIYKKYNIDLIPCINPYKHYDLYYKKIYKIEYKGIYYKLDESANTATNKKNTVINDVMISREKIFYYHYRLLKNPQLRFILIYGFYNIGDDDIIKVIKYRFIEITNDLLNILTTYKQIIYRKSKFFLIPIINLKMLKYFELFNNNIS